MSDGCFDTVVRGFVGTSRMTDQQSITVWFDQLRAGDEDAARQLWKRYFSQLVTLAGRHVGKGYRRAADEEDVAQCVFHALCRGAARGQFPDIHDRQDLWRLLLSMTRRQAVDQVRGEQRLKRGGGQVRGDSVFANSSGESGGIDQIAGEQPTPETLVAMDESFQNLLSGLRNETLRQIAVWRMEGRSNAEIAESLQVTERTVERKLGIIRQDWSQAIDESASTGG